MKKIAVITGASSGMGKEFAIRLAEDKKVEEVWVIARREDRLKELASVIAKPLKAIPLDLTDSESFETYKAMLEEENPEVLFLANCSGFGKFGHYYNVPLSESLNMIDLNVKALVAMTELTLPYMPKGSSVIQLDSLSSFQPVPRITVYGATKAFVLSYSRAMNEELKDRDIHMMAVCPGWVATEFFDRAMTAEDNSVNYFNIVYKPEDVVNTAIRDMYKRKKDVSIHGLPVKLQVLGVKLLPHSLIMKIWLKQQSGKNSKKEDNK